MCEEDITKYSIFCLFYCTYCPLLVIKITEILIDVPAFLFFNSH